ncbi:MAG TPA: MFS transporter [Novosphingobium sp.]|nr:MFS transporter [Novosphingobium sp.]HZV09088.1 MFS transporter [Novosphingobium sp.]
MASFSASGTVSVRPFVTVEGQQAPARDGRWSRLQVLVVALCFVLNMLDGMDVLILSYIAPALSADWHLAPDQMGTVFSAGLAGMAAGGLLLAPMADRFGRRRLILVSLLVMTAAMFGSVFCHSLWQLLAARFAVGVGIGSVLASMAALTAEYAPAHHRAFAVGFLQAGYPVGATITGFVVAAHLATHGWQAMLLGAAVLCALALPVVFLLLPESIAFLAARQPKGALAEINRQLAQMGEAPLDALPPRRDGAEAPHTGLRGLMAEGRLPGTLLLWAAIIFSFMTLYFVISWIPKLSIEAGLSPRHGIYAGAIYNIGAFIGTSSVGLVAMRLELRKVILGYMVLAALALVAFGSLHMPLALTLLTAFLIGLFVQGGFNGCYPLATGFYPAEVRSAGLGWAMGMGRIGAVIGPMLGGYLLTAKVALPVIFGVFAAPIVVAGLLVVLIRQPARS